ncbi:hypothetical protein EV421DRAFT_1848553 [Armillaria borealis]|uniref:Uncharacterized protein n=1 Tax=Armillaria borealis TaxID=47425 RepID=A0AA39IXV4_9AGAR|nr:hypothetical protein EV421DRAFT_1848553 [Armillaria borealis]
MTLTCWFGFFIFGFVDFAPTSLSLSILSVFVQREFPTSRAAQRPSASIARTYSTVLFTGYRGQSPHSGVVRHCVQVRPQNAMV